MQSTKYTINEVAKNLVNFCCLNNKKFIYISGNGGSGKTTLGNLIIKEASKLGKVNMISTDDFIVDTELRNNSKISWHDQSGTIRSGRYTSSVVGSYFLQSLNAIILNLKRGNDYYHCPKKARSDEEPRLLYGNAIMTIVEGVGTVFLERNKEFSLSVFLYCNKETEIERRINRKEKSNEQTKEDVIQKLEERRSQYESLIEFKKEEFDLILESISDFSLKLEKDRFKIFN